MARFKGEILLKSLYPEAESKETHSLLSKFRYLTFGVVALIFKEHTYGSITTSLSKEKNIKTNKL